MFFVCGLSHGYLKFTALIPVCPANAKHIPQVAVVPLIERSHETDSRLNGSDPSAPGDFLWTGLSPYHQCLSSLHRTRWVRRTRSSPDMNSVIPLFIKNPYSSSSHPGYWKAYRKRSPEKAERNRMLQTVRNPRRKNAEGDLIAKMDAAKVNIHTITGTWRTDGPA